MSGGKKSKPRESLFSKAKKLAKKVVETPLDALKRHFAKKGTRKPHEIEYEHKFFATLSQAAYLPTWTEKQSLVDTNVPGEGFFVSKKYSRQGIDVWLSGADSVLQNAAVLVFKGTSSIDDVITDIDIVQGKFLEAKRFQQDVNASNSIISKLKRLESVATIYMTGHSLGGTLAVEIGRIHKDDMGAGHVHAFNPGSGKKEAMESIDAMFSGSKDSHIHRYHVYGDGLSTLSGGMTDHFYRQMCGVNNPHSIENFTGINVQCDDPMDEEK